MSEKMVSSVKTRQVDLHGYSVQSKYSALGNIKENTNQ